MPPQRRKGTASPASRKLCAFRPRKKVFIVFGVECVKLRKKVFLVFGGHLRRSAALFRECLFVFEQQVPA
jgi:hypothetical protein